MATQSNVRSTVSPAFYAAIESFVMQKMDANDLFAKKVCNPKKNIYDRKNSLILSARLIDTPDTPLETIELSLTDGHILQCYGSHNQETQYHNEIISLVNQHSHLILAA